MCALSSLVVAVALVPSVSQAQSTTGNQGLQDGWAIDNNGSTAGWHLLIDEFGFMQEAGAGWVRINFRLGDCFRDWTTLVTQSDVNSGRCDPSTLGKRAQDQYDTVVSSALARNLKVLGLLSNESWNGSPEQWRANSAEQRQGSGDNAYIGGFASSAAGVLAGHFDGRHGPLVSQWEIWNEPNGTNDQPENGTFIYPSNFAWLLKRSYSAIKSANPQATVVSGGVLGLDQEELVIKVAPQVRGAIPRVVKRRTYTDPGSTSGCPNTLPSGSTYLCQTYYMGRTQADWRSTIPFDDVGLHLYLDLGGTTAAAKISTFLRDVRQAYTFANGNSSVRRTQVTEFGWPTTADWAEPGSGLDPAVQAQNLRTAYQVFRQDTTVARAYWFRTQDLPWDGYGLVTWTADTTPGGEGRKAAFSVYQQAAR
jgi:hypothetical protein